MKKLTLKTWIIGFGILGLLVLQAACGPEPYANKDNLAALVELEFPGNAQPENAQIAKLRTDLSKLEAEIKQLMEAKGRQSVFWNSLGEEYRKLGMFKPALESYERSIEIKANNYVALYRAGLMAAQLSKVAADASQGRTFLEKAIRYYEAALTWYPDYSEALYALAVVYSFEKKDYLRARTLLDHDLVMWPEDTKAMFLLARIEYEEGAFGKAAALYRKIIAITKDLAVKSEAQANLEQTLLRQ